MGWTIKIKRGTRCGHCKELWRGGVWLITYLGTFCSSRCFTDAGGNVWEGIKLIDA